MLFSQNRSSDRSVKHGSVYESVVASELIAHGCKLFYYDNQSKGEVDYLIDDYETFPPFRLRSNPARIIASQAAYQVKMNQL